MSDDNILYDCEYVKSVADEYLHGELSETEKESAERHISECGECRTFYDEEKKLTDMIKATAYSPESPVADFVMGKIIDEKIVIQKSRGKRPVPFGMISAAAIIVIMIAVSRTPIGDILGITMSKNSSLDNAVPESALGQAAELGTVADMPINENSVIMSYYGNEESVDEAKADTGGVQPRGVGEAGAVQFSLNVDNYADTEIDGQIAPEPEVAGVYAEAAVETPAPAAAPAVVVEAPVGETQSQFGVAAKLMSDIPMPTGEFCEREVALIICANVLGDAKEQLIENILADIEKAELSATASNVIYTEEKYYNAVIDIFSRNGVGYEIRDGSAGANEIAVFFY